MKQYIDKAVLMAEIERRLERISNTSAGNNRRFAATLGAQHYELISLVQFIDTLEVKEVDFETAAHGRIDYPFIGHDFPNIYPNYKELKDYCDKNDIKDEDKIKIIIIKDDII